MTSREEINKTWQDEWDRNHCPWDMPGGNPYLKKHFKDLVEDRVNGMRILVPLCGATVDMAWFYKQGLTVVGVELFEKACKQFFERLSLSYSIEEKDGYTVYIHDERLKIYQCDFFKTDQIILGGNFDYLFDVGGLVAMVPAEQQKYVDHLTTLLTPTARGLLECFEYDTSLRSGHPHSISTNALKGFFGGRYEMEELSRKMEYELPDDYTVSLYLLRRVGNVSRLVSLPNIVRKYI